jgi:hypothetical protein
MENELLQFMTCCNNKGVCMNDVLSEKGFLTNDEFSICKNRLINILLLNQYRLFCDKEVEIDRRIKQSVTCGSLCLTDELPSEIWLPYQKTEYKVSNFGRVKLGKEIVPQTDQPGKIGWLILDEKSFGKPLLKELVYRLIAETFLEKPQNGSYHIHHITNNGYDNSISNLIYLTKDQHDQVENSVVKYKKWRSRS